MTAMIKEYYNKGWSINFGYSKRFGIGISIDKWSASVDFLCFWIAIEW
jgi:hypothetical protein